MYFCNCKLSQQSERKGEITHEIIFLLQGCRGVAVPGLEVAEVVVRERSLGEGGTHGLHDMDLAHEASNERSWEFPPREMVSVLVQVGDESNVVGLERILAWNLAPG